MERFRLGRHDGLQWRDALLAVALFAAIVRSLVPQGFMPGLQDNHLTIVLCTAYGAGTLGGDTDRTPLQDAFEAVHKPCAGVALAGMAPPPELPILSLPRAIAAGIVAVDATPAVGVARPFRPQAPRAPPQQV